MKIVFIMDRVRHYHLPLFVALDKRLGQLGHQFVLLAGESRVADTGRVSIAEKIVEHQLRYGRVEVEFGSYTFRRSRGVSRIVNELRPEVIITPSHVGNIDQWLLMAWKRRRGGRLIAWQCGYEYNESPWKRLLLRRFLQGFDHHLAYHSNARQYAIGHGVDAGRITVIHNTIDESAIRLMGRSDARRDLDTRHPTLTGRRIVLYVGALLEEKRLDVLIDVVKESAMRDLGLVIVGDGPAADALRQRAEGMPNVVFTGHVVEKVGVYFDSADVFVLPGTGGLAINEAMAHGLPVIAGYADGSADDLVTNGENGFRLQKGDAGELSEALVSVLSDASVIQRMGAESRRRIVEEFSFDMFLGRVLQGVQSQLLQPAATPAVSGS